MSVKCQIIMDAMEKLAPRHLAESWDNVGLLLGSPAQSVNKVLVTLDVTKTVVEQAVKDGVDLIIAHHPVIFKGINNIRTDLPQGQLLAMLLKANISVYAAHTNLDSATGGVNDILAERFNLHSIQPLAVSSTEKLFKLVIFVPQTHLGAVRKAISDVGAGHIGNYSHCTFQSSGTGTFLPLEGTKPFIGEQGKIEYVEEFRLETIMPEKISKRVIKAMLKAHPYEEVAYDMYQLVNPGNSFGLGRVGKLSVPMTIVDFANIVKATLGIDYLSIAGPCDKIVKKVAVCGGSGAGLLHKAMFAGADVLVTGDVKYHEAQDALALGISIIDAGHFATEQPVVSYVAEYLNTCANNAKWTVDISADSVNKDVFRVY